MRFRLLFALMSISLILSACNLGSSNQEEDEIIPTLPEASGRPSVSIISPANGSTSVVNEQILVSVSATDSRGVTRVQLFADGQIVKTISSESINGDTSFEGILDFTPRLEGEYVLRVLAFRDAVSSEPAEITVTVGEEEIQVTERPSGSASGSTSGSGSSSGGGANVPVIPNDGLCRVLTNVGLNFRSEPTTSRDNVISTLNSGTLLVVVARLGDNSWWKVNSGSRVGWVSGSPQYTTLYGNCQTIPVENFTVNTATPTRTNTPSVPTATFTPSRTPTPGSPDLIIPTLVSTVDEIIIPTGATEVTVEFGVTVKNQGSGTSGSFGVTMRVGSTTYDLGVIGSLGAGQIITLTQNVTFNAAGDYDIRADVDPLGQVTESIEVNNRADITVTVTNE